VTILQNPVIPIVVRFSMSECSLRVENRRTLESIRPDRLPYVESACAALGKLLAPVVERQRGRAMDNASARTLTAEIASVAAKVTEETDVLFAVTLETDEDRERLDQEARRIVADIGLTVAPPPSEEKDAEIARLRAEIDAARAEFFACAEAIGIVYETDGHASAPGPVETVVDFIREARRRSLEHVDCEMRRSAVDTYTVEVPAALVERALNPEHYDGEKLCPTCRERMPEAGEPFGHDTNECARKALLDAVLSQLGAKP